MLLRTPSQNGPILNALAGTRTETPQVRKACYHLNVPQTAHLLNAWQARKQKNHKPETCALTQTLSKQPISEGICWRTN